jgi:hypothetical protein
VKGRRRTRGTRKSERKLLTSWDGANGAIRSMRRYFNEITLPKGGVETLKRAIGYFVNHRSRMRYAEWLAQGSADRQWSPSKLLPKTSCKLE